jgi:CubicO group peptidase (beta-lactamase class C family)
VSLAGLLLATQVATASAPEIEAALLRARAAVDGYARRHLAEAGVPGIALAVTDRSGLLQAGVYGSSDARSRDPLTNATLFPIGSISKAFTAVLLLQLQDEGRFDPRLPVARYLPWFRTAGQASLTAHQLLTHTADIPRDRDDIPSGPYQAFALRERPPGNTRDRFWYSNVGYQVLGQVAEAIGGQPLPRLLHARVLDPLAMSMSEPAITGDLRLRMAVGHVPQFDDRPAPPLGPLVPATWIDYGSGDGGVAATASDLAAFARLLLNRGQGPKGRLLSEAAFARLLEPVVLVSGAGDTAVHYAYGLQVSQAEGRSVFAHTGGMVGHTAVMIGDLTAGVAVVALANVARAGYRPREVAEYALAAHVAALAGRLPPPAPASDPWAVEGVSDYVGHYAADGGWTFDVVAESNRLLLVADGRRSPLLPQGKDRFLADRPELALFLLDFGRDAAGAVVEAFHGGDWFPGARYTGRRSFQHPPEWDFYVGHYRASQAFANNFRVVLRKGRLLLVWPEGTEEALAAAGPGGAFRVGERTPERITFDSVVSGRALRATLSGCAYYRVFTP